MMNNIKKILNNQLIKKEQTIKNENYLKAKNNFENLLNVLTNYNIISNNLEGIGTEIFELQFKSGVTKEEVLKKDIENFLEYFTNVKDTEDKNIYEDMLNIASSQTVYSNFNEFINIEKNTNVMQNIFDILYNKLQYIEEFEIVFNRINYFFNCETFFKQRGNLISFNSEKEKECVKEAEDDYVTRKRYIKYLKSDKIKELNSLNNLYDKEEINDKNNELIQRISELESKLQETNTKLEEVNVKIEELTPKKGSE